MNRSISDQPMHRAIRLADMLWRFDKGKRMTMREICERYGVSCRTVQRDLRDIERWVIPIDVEKMYSTRDSGQPERRYGMWRFKE